MFSLSSGPIPPIMRAVKHTDQWNYDTFSYFSFDFLTIALLSCIIFLCSTASVLTKNTRFITFDTRLDLLPSSPSKAAHDCELLVPIFLKIGYVGLTICNLYSIEFLILSLSDALHEHVAHYIVEFLTCFLKTY